jgi:hypothetical protein
MQDNNQEYDENTEGGKPCSITNRVSAIIHEYTFRYMLFSFLLRGIWGARPLRNPQRLQTSY